MSTKFSFSWQLFYIGSADEKRFIIHNFCPCIVLQHQPEVKKIKKYSNGIFLLPKKPQKRMFMTSLFFDFVGKLAELERIHAADEDDVQSIPFPHVLEILLHIFFLYYWGFWMFCLMTVKNNGPQCRTIMLIWYYIILVWSQGAKKDCGTKLITLLSISLIH